MKIGERIGSTPGRARKCCTSGPTAAVFTIADAAGAIASSSGDAKASLAPHRSIRHFLVTVIDFVSPVAYAASLAAGASAIPPLRVGPLPLPPCRRRKARWQADPRPLYRPPRLSAPAWTPQGLQRMGRVSARPFRQAIRWSASSSAKVVPAR